MESKIALVMTFVALMAVQLHSQTKTSGDTSQKPSITFVELGSVNCIPCRQMQPVMKSIEDKYAGQVKVVFHDVWKEDQRRYAEEYKIRVIPTQVFLDQDGRELMRHEGFFPEKDIDVFLEAKGLKPKVNPKE
jgi:thioredoxin 1